MQRMRRLGLQRVVVAATLLLALALTWFGREHDVLHGQAVFAHVDAHADHAGDGPVPGGPHEAGSAVCQLLDQLLSDEPRKVPPLAALQPHRTWPMAA